LLIWLLVGLWAGLVAGFGVVIGLLGVKIKQLTRHGNRRRLNESLNLVKKLSWQTFFETNIRAATGRPVDRPYGSQGAFFNWDQIIFNPVYYTAKPLASEAPVDTTVTLGPLARKPLQLQIPILIGGMAYGSGYSAAAKIGLAQAATMVGTAANSGNGPFLAAERQYARRFILQYPRGFWNKQADLLRQADMIEIALGHSARGSAPVRIMGQKVNEVVAQGYGTLPGLAVLMESRLPEVETREDWPRLVASVKELTGGVPVAVKLGASHYLETELDLLLEGEVDVIVFDGLEGGTHGGAPVFMDDMGLPLLPALCRATRMIRDKGLQGRVSLVVGGGLNRPGDFAKCLALGADAVLVGTITALVQTHTQITKSLPWEPPTQLLYNDGQTKERYNPDVGAQHLGYYLKSCVGEMTELSRSLGKKRLSDLDRQDLMALDPLSAMITDLPLL
jgi:glutamate synthase domain-containing protein 2